MGKKRRTCKCPLCHIKRKVWEDKGFFGISDKYTGKPMIVLTEHRGNLQGDEKNIILKLKDKYHPTLFINPEDVMGVDLERQHWSTTLSRKKFGTNIK